MTKNAYTTRTDKRGKVVTMPAGTYWLGDPCYAFTGERDALWSKFLNDADYMKNNDVLVAMVDGFPVLGLGTFYGDGYYPAGVMELNGEFNSDFMVGVDAGLVGLVPIEFAPAKAINNLMTVVGFEKPVECWADADGTLHFGEFIVLTGDYEDDDDHDEDDNEF